MKLVIQRPSASKQSANYYSIRLVLQLLVFVVVLLGWPGISSPKAPQPTPFLTHLNAADVCKTVPLA